MRIARHHDVTIRKTIRGPSTGAPARVQSMSHHEPDNGVGQEVPSDMHVHPEVAEALGRLCDVASTRRPDDPLLPRFLEHYYAELGEDELDDRRIDDIYAAAVAHLTLGRVRAPGQPVVRAISPDRERDGWRCDHSVLLVVTDDMPFLVDTIRMVLDRRGLGIHLLVHPMLAVARDEQHTLLDVAADDGSGRALAELGPGARTVEAWTQIELDRVDDEEAAALEADVAMAVDAVRRIVDDFGPMRDRMQELTPIDPLLSWFAEGRFVFLGSAVYDRAADGTVTVREGTELGLSRNNARVLRPRPIPGDGPVAIARTDDMARVFRAQRQTLIAVRPEGLSSSVETRFVGLLATSAYRSSVLEVPGIGPAVQERLALTEERMHSHAGRETRNVLENLPRDLVLEQPPDRLAELVTDIVGLQERRLVRVFEVPDPAGPWATVLVYLPKARFTAELPEKVADVVAEAYGVEERTFEPLVTTSTLARIAVSVRRPDDSVHADLDELEQAVNEVSTSWSDRLRRALIDELGEEQGRELFDRVGTNAPGSYRAGVSPEHAVHDLRRVQELADGDRDLMCSVSRDLEAGPGEWRVRVYRCAQPATLAELLPVLDNLGLHALDERPSTFRVGSQRVYLYDIGVRLPGELEPDRQRATELERAVCALLTGEVENDGFNRLVLLAGLTVREVAAVRAYGKYLRQIGFAFSQSYIESTLASHPQIVRDILALFHARFDPTLGDDNRAEREAEIRERLLAALDEIPSLDDDRICRAFVTLAGATVRTNYYRGRPAIAFKFDPTAIPELPLPRPAKEIWVCGPRVEGVHLRGGPIARGGLRWSDRREDFRTEVLGLMKAQMVKNAVIVPAGAKGGFVVKRPPTDPDAMRAEVVECYRAFISGMLDLTDNRVSGPDGDRIVHPPDTVVHDEDDPYLVVAADKGTATFSDIANEIALQHGFWLGDAFASGGSTGYDHKAMGITARGAWESVRRHARVLGKDADHDPLTVVGIGDMSGDVFGNGMLRSKEIRLVAAFDHRHIFIDPDPEPHAAFAERRRLYDLPRSSWADYEPTVLSPGGAIYPRTQKSIELSEEARKVLDAPGGPLTPNEVVSAILKAPVDLLWNGGIGTYVKASTETHAEVGDRANDGLRVNGCDLRCKIVAEGGNLGLTQRGRVEYALAGGLVNTDAIDNSAGVDCSDHEVNIKILLDGLVQAGELTVKQRNELLASMTDEVAELVLDNNRAQTLALLITRRQALPMVNVHARYLDLLESEGWLDRQLEFLPTDRMIAERQSTGAGLQTPEFAVLMAYTKNVNIGELIASDLPDAALFDADLRAYFPSPLRDRFADAIRAHPLRRELIATLIGNQMVNLSGISFDHRMTEDTGASVIDVTRAWVAARDIVDFPKLWAEIDELTHVPLETQFDLFLDCRRMAERAALWLLRHRRPPLDMAAAIAEFRPGMETLATAMEPALTGRMRAIVHSVEASRLAAGVPEGLAERAGVWPLLHTGFDLIEVAHEHNRPVADVARLHWRLFDYLDLAWLWEGIGALPRSDRWQTQARSALRDDLLSAMAELTTAVIERSGGSVDAWAETNERSISRSAEMFTQIRRAESFDLTTLSVALRQLRNLSLTTVAT